VPFAGDGLASRSQNRNEERPYLDRPLFPLAVALPRMLEKVAVELTKAEPPEKARLQQRAEVLREWITPKSTMPLST
jgi:hypothetical protein